MKKVGILVCTVCLVLAVSNTGQAQRGFKVIHEVLTGYEEVPSVSTEASGEFRARISNDGMQIDYELTYSDLLGDVLQAHIHLGQRGANGGVAVFLCSNLGNGPAGTQACPTTSPARIEGTITAADIVGPSGQGLAAGEMAEFLDALRAGVTYVNIHSSMFPGGEIRSQINGNRGFRNMR